MSASLEQRPIPAASKIIGCMLLDRRVSDYDVPLAAGSPDEARTSVELSVRASSLRNAGSASHQRPSSDKAHADRAELDDSPMHMSADDSPFRSAASRSEAASPIAVSAAADVIERSSSAASSPDKRTIDRDKGRSRQRSSVSPAVTPPGASTNQHWQHLLTLLLLHVLFCCTAGCCHCGIQPHALLNCVQPGGG